MTKLQQIYLFLFLSGLAALLYELGFERKLELFFGNSAYSVTTILTSFFLGLLIGSVLAWHIIRKFKKLLWAYALIELCIAAFSLLGLGLFNLISSHTLVDFSSFNLPGFLVGIIVTLPQMIAIGATLPILLQVTKKLTSVDFSRLYLINTLGAASAIILATFVVIPKLGTNSTLYLAVGINMAIFLIASRLKNFLSDLPSKMSLTIPARTSLALSFVAGFAAIALETALTKTVILQTGASIYSISFTILAVILGIALAAYLVQVLVPRIISTRAMLMTALVASVANLALLFIFYDGLTDLTLAVARNNGNVLVTILIMTLIIATPISTLIGMILPLVFRLQTSDAPGSRLSWLMGANNLGSIIAPVVVSFLLIPNVRLSRTLALISLILALGLLLVYRRSHKSLVAIPVVLVALTLIFLPGWTAEQLSKGPLVNSANPTVGKVIYSRYGTLAFVDVERFGTDLVLRTNGKVDASTSGDLGTELAQAHVPGLLHNGQATKALVIGIGSGITAGALTQYGLDRIDTVEIEPAIFEASKLFGDFNHHYWGNPTIQIHFNDARNFLAINNNKYDFITSEPSNPWIAGIGNLFTKEYFTQMRGHLSEKGLVAQWIHVYSMKTTNLRDIFATFQAVFPNSYVWESLTTSDLLLLGSINPLEIDDATLRRRYDIAKPDMSKVNQETPELFMGGFVMGPVNFAKFSQGGRILTDDIPTLEFSAPLELLSDTTPANLSALNHLSEPPSVVDPTFDIDSYIKISHYRYLARQAKIEINSGQTEAGRKDLEEAIAIYPHPLLVSILANIYLDKALGERNSGDIDGFNRDINRAIQLNPAIKGQLLKL